MKRFAARPGNVMQGYRFALDPNRSQESALLSHCGAARAAYNWAVNWVLSSWQQRTAELTYGIPEDGLTPWRPWSLPSLRKAFNREKHTDPRFCTWWPENSKEAYSTGLANASAAFENYARSKNAKRGGKRVGAPRIKSKRKARLSCRFTTGAIRINADGRHVTLPRLGTIRIHEPAHGLLARLESGSARLLSAAVRHDRGRWFVSFQVEGVRDGTGVAQPDVAVGIDLGIHSLAVMADSAGRTRIVPNPRHFDQALAGLRRACRIAARRQGPDRKAGLKPSRRWEQANARRNKAHYRVANLREDALHKLTAGVTSEYGTVVIEDLHVAGMLRNRSLARRIADAGLAEIRRQLTYKTRERQGTNLVVADRWYPSSKTCSGCGAVKAKLLLHVRTYRCDICRLVLDRDVNAARNLAVLAATRTTGTGVAGDQDSAPAESKPRGVDQKTRITRDRLVADAGRAGGATPPHPRRQEARDRTQAEAPTLW